MELRLCLFLLLVATMTRSTRSNQPANDDDAMDKVSKTLLKIRRPKVLVNRALFSLDAASAHILHGASHREKPALEPHMETKMSSIRREPKREPV